MALFEFDAVPQILEEGEHWVVPIAALIVPRAPWPRRGRLVRRAAACRRRGHHHRRRQQQRAGQPRLGVEPSGAVAGKLSRYVKRHLSAHAYPREVEFVAEPPQAPGGSV